MPTKPGSQSLTPAGSRIAPPYPDLPVPITTTSQAEDRGHAGHVGAPAGTSQVSSGRIGPILLTIAGRNRQQLDFRLLYLVKDFVSYAVDRPGRPARLEPYGEQATWVMDALIAATHARVNVADHDERLHELTDAVRLAEERWQKVRSDIRREVAVRTDLRPSPVLDRRMPRRTARRQARLYNERHPSRARLVATPSGVPASTTATPCRDGQTQQGGIAAQRVAAASRLPSQRA
jgi:hypothetical protein